jgi:hypothetical protein
MQMKTALKRGNQDEVDSGLCGVPCSGLLDTLAAPRKVFGFRRTDSGSDIAWTPQFAHRSIRSARHANISRKTRRNKGLMQIELLGRQG